MTNAKNVVELETNKMTERVYLTRRNLKALLSKLDRVKAGEVSACTIVKRDNKHATYPQTMHSIEVIAIEDDEYYTDRNAGDVYHKDVPK